MKQLFTLCICIFISLTLVACNNIQEVITTTSEKSNEGITEDSKDSFEKETNEHLLSRIESLEKEIDLIKETLQVETGTINNNYGLIINALENVSSDDIIIHIERNDGYLKEVHVKVPLVEYLSYDYYLLTGFENNGVRIYNCLIEPIIETSDNPQNRDIDLKKFDLIKLMLSDIKYDEFSIALIIIKDSNGKEYSKFIYSDKSMEGDM